MNLYRVSLNKKARYDGIHSILVLSEDEKTASETWPDSIIHNDVHFDRSLDKWVNKDGKPNKWGDQYWDEPSNLIVELREKDVKSFCVNQFSRCNSNPVYFEDEQVEL